MKKAEALEAIRQEWMARPASERANSHQAMLFTFDVLPRYSFKASGDRYQVVMAHLYRWTGLP